MTGNEQTEKIYGYFSPVSSGTISEITGISSSALSNRKSRDKDFPTDRNNDKGSPFYYYGDVLKWAFAHDISIYGRKVFFRDIEIMERDSMNRSLNIGIVGRSRGGKSFISAYFMENTLFMRRILSGGGADFTQIPTKITIDGSSPYFRFYVREGFAGDERVGQIPEELKCYVNKPVTIDVDAPDFEDAIGRINEWLRSLHKKEIDNLEQFVSLEIATRPSDMAKRIMERTGKRSIVVLDTPGLSGDYTFDDLGRQDVVIIVMRNDSMQEFVGSFQKISDLVGTNTVVYSYTTEYNVTEKDEFEEAQEEGEKDIKKFEAELVRTFDRGSVIDSSINALHPLEHFVTLPIFKKNKYSEVEKLYENRLEDLIVEGFGHQISAEGLRSTLKESKKTGEEVLGFLKEIIYVPTINGRDPESRSSTLQEFKDASHARVKSQDGYRVLSVVNRASLDLLKKNKEKLEQFKAEDFQNEEWKQILIKYVYQVTDRTMKDYPGVGNGTHPFEDSPAVTMRACESILAKELYERLKGYEKEDGTEPDSQQRIMVTRSYREVLQENDIRSASWDRVTANPYTIGSLKVLVESGFLDVSCDSEKELIINSAVNGLYFRAVVDIYTDVLIGIDAYEGPEPTIQLVKRELFT